ncbi:MAG: reverse transcriptase family protein [Planctomycetota bacterium]
MGLIDWLRRQFLGSRPAQESSGATSGHPSRFPGTEAAANRGASDRLSPAIPSPATPSPAISPPSHADVDGLDASKFQAPVDGDALTAVPDPNWPTVFWDPRNEIPPETLPRIQAIDRRMVAMGLISQEELSAIHKVGRRMEPYRTDAGAERAAGDRAVAQDRAQRQEAKAQKKAEAAERKRLHEAAVKHRRQTDIVYLGRGVSRGVADRRAHVEKLQAAGLPVMAAPADLAAKLNIDIPQLRWLAFENPMSRTNHYFTFAIEKRGGGERLISKPHERLAAAQYWIFENILGKLDVHPAAHGFVRGRSTVTGARVHERSSVLVGMDLRDFFPSIDFYRVEGWFRGLGYSPAVATILALLCTESPRQEIQRDGQRYFVSVGPRALPQGVCTSPAISNGIARRLDFRLDGYAKKSGWRYTRYADDMTFSMPRRQTDAVPAKNSGSENSGADDRAQTDPVRALLDTTGRIIRDEGFTRHPEKTRVQRPNQRQSVTGIVVNEHVSIDRPTLRRLRAILHRAKTEGLAAQNRDNHPNFESWLLGMIAYVEMVQPDQGQKLRDQFADLG